MNVPPQKTNYNLIKELNFFRNLCRRMIITRPRIETQLACLSESLNHCFSSTRLVSCLHQRTFILKFFEFLWYFLNFWVHFSCIYTLYKIECFLSVCPLYIPIRPDRFWWHFLYVFEWVLGMNLDSQLDPVGPTRGGAQTQTSRFIMDIFVYKWFLLVIGEIISRS